MGIVWSPRDRKQGLVAFPHTAPFEEFPTETMHTYALELVVST